MQRTKTKAVLHEPNKKLMFPPIGGELITYRPKGMDFMEYKRIQANQKKLIEQRKRGWYVQHNQHINKLHGPVKNLPVL